MWGDGLTDWGFSDMMATMNNQAFIDGQNLTYNTQNSDKPWKVDLIRFRVYLKERYGVQQAYYFMGYHLDELYDLYNLIQEAGFIVVFRKYDEKMASIKKGNVDTDIVFAIMRKLVEQEDFEKVILVSGDGDYYRMVDYLVKKNKFGKLLAPNQKCMSSLYKNLDRSLYTDLSARDVKKKIEFKKGRRVSKKRDTA